MLSWSIYVRFITFLVQINLRNCWNASCYMPVHNHHTQTTSPHISKIVNEELVKLKPISVRTPYCDYRQFSFKFHNFIYISFLTSPIKLKDFVALYEVYALLGRRRKEGMRSWKMFYRYMYNHSLLYYPIYRRLWYNVHLTETTKILNYILVHY